MNICFFSLQTDFYIHTPIHPTTYVRAYPIPFCVSHAYEKTCVLYTCVLNNHHVLTYYVIRQTRNTTWRDVLCLHNTLMFRSSKSVLWLICPNRTTSNKVLWKIYTYETHTQEYASTHHEVYVVIRHSMMTKVYSEVCDSRCIL